MIKCHANATVPQSRRFSNETYNEEISTLNLEFTYYLLPVGWVKAKVKKSEEEKHQQGKQKEGIEESITF